jgi:hypothetical protein
MREKKRMMFRNISKNKIQVDLKTKDLERERIPVAIKARDVGK